MKKIKSMSLLVLGVSSVPTMQSDAKEISSQVNAKNPIVGKCIVLIPLLAEAKIIHKPKNQDENGFLANPGDPIKPAAPSLPVTTPITLNLKDGKIISVSRLSWNSKLKRT